MPLITQPTLTHTHTHKLGQATRGNMPRILENLIILNGMITPLKYLHYQGKLYLGNSNEHP